MTPLVQKLRKGMEDTRELLLEAFEKRHLMSVVHSIKVNGKLPNTKPYLGKVYKNNQKPKG